MADINVIVFGNDCVSEPGAQVTAAECTAIAAVFVAAAEAINEGKHGEIFCKPEGYEMVLAAVGIDQGGEFDEVNGLPTLEEIKIG